MTRLGNLLGQTLRCSFCSTAGGLKADTNAVDQFYYISARYLSTTALSQDIFSVMADKIPEQQDRMKQLKKQGDKVLGNVTVAQAIGGMRGIKGLFCDTSSLDPEEGIRFRGYTIPEIQVKLPKASGGDEPLPEGMLWLLLTGEIPTQQQVEYMKQELQSRSTLPPTTHKVLDSLPVTTHPMTQLCHAALSLQSQSKFAAAYERGVHKSKYWEPYLSDSLDLIAKLPQIAAIIYNRAYRNGVYEQPDPKLDWAANYSHQLGFNSELSYELMRLYQTIHTDHEGGNASAHTSTLVSSTLADPYLSYTASMTALAGPLHGLANQEVLRWVNKMVEEVGLNPSQAQIEQYVKDTLASGKVVPGFGHAVLRKTDPRYTCQREFAFKHLPDDPLFKIVDGLYQVVPKVLAATGKVANPYPNVDAHSGVLLNYVGLSQARYYTVLFGVSRSMGVLSQCVWARALGMAIERPKSMTFTQLEAT